MLETGAHPDTDNQWRYDEVVNGKKNYIGEGVKVVSGEGDFKTNKPEDVYENISSNKNHGFGFLNEYRNLEISEETILRISRSANVQFSLARKYDFSRETEEAKKDIVKATRELEAQKRVVESEISTIKQEIEILNNELIKKYYNFSDYSKITSQDCKNKLVLLKQKEHELREQGKDVVIQNKYERTNKTAGRIIRQMLRTFNAECDNIMMNISLKNLFKHNAAEITDILLKNANGDPKLALQKLNAYLQRSLEQFSDTAQINLAKHQLEDLVRQQSNP